MAYDPKKRDAKTRNGKRASFLKYDDFCWPCPWIFLVDGEKRHYSIGGFYSNHQEPMHELDLIADWNAAPALDTWPTRGPEFNAWNLDLDKFMAVLNENKDTRFWLVDSDLKYLNIRIDTRDNSFAVFAEGEEIDPNRVLNAIRTFNEKYQ